MLAERYRIPIEKATQLQDILRQKSIDGWLIFSREHSDPTLPFLIGDDAVHTAAALFLPNGKHLILTSKSDQAKYEESGIFHEVVVYDQDIAPVLKQVIDTLQIKKLALNISETETLCDGLTQGLYLQLEKILGKEFIKNHTVSSEEIIVTLRSKKSDTELMHIRQAIDITQKIYQEVFQQINVGMTEIEIADKFVEGMKKYQVTNGVGKAYEHPIVCLVRAGLAHRNPGPTRSIPGDILIMDFSVRYKNYVSDIARTAYFLKENETKPPEEIQKAFEAAYDGITNSINMLKVGNKGFEVDAVGRKTIEEAGYPTVRHSVGHQIGIACHEVGTRISPKSRPYADGDIELSHVYAIEPTVIQDEGLPCMLVEENVLVTEGQPEILSVRQEELVLIPFTN